MNESSPCRLLIHFRNGRVQPVLIELPPSQSDAYQNTLKQFSQLPGLRYIEVLPPASPSPLTNASLGIAV